MIPFDLEFEVSFLKWTAERLVVGGWTNVPDLIEVERGKAATKCQK